MGQLFNPIIFSSTGGSGGGGASVAFTTIQPDSGTSPTALTSTDTLTLHSSDASITITGNSATNTVNFTATGGGGSTFSDAAFAVNDAVDASKQFKIDAAGTTSTSTTLQTSQTVNRIITLPDAAGTIALTANNLSVFASTTSAQLAGVLSDETGTGKVVFSASPTFTGTIGAATITATGAVTGSNLSGTNTGDQTITLTGDITGSGTGSFATTLAAIQGTSVSGTTGTGNVMFSASPTTTGTLTAAAISASGTIAGSNLSGTNTGDITLAAVGASPSANAATLSSQQLTLQPADATHPGVITTGTQTLAGQKTFSTGVTTTVTGHSTLDLALTGGTLSGAINMGSNQINAVTDPTSAQDAATKNYVDSVASGIQPIEAVTAASTANISGTYLNGTAGIGATFTVTATGALSLDGQSPAANTRVLIKNQTSGFQNGVYNVTVAGTTGVSPVLTRSSDYNTASEMNAGNLIPVINGTVNALTSWLNSAMITTVGTDSLTFVQWTANPGNYLLKANNLSDVTSANTSFNNISPLTTLGDIIYEDVTPKAVRLAGNITSTKNFLVQTGTGSVSAAPVWGTIVSGDIPTLNQNTSGSAASFTGSLSGDVTGIQGATVVSKIAGTTVSGATGTTNVMFSASPTTTGTMIAAAITMSSTLAMTNSNVTTIKQAVYNGIIDDGNSGTSKTIDWTTGSLHKIAMTGNCAFTFTAPTGVARVQLMCTQDATGGRTATWPTSAPKVFWSNAAPILTPTPTTGVDIFTFIYDGTNYYGMVGPNFV